MHRYVDRLAALEASRLVAALGGLVLAMVLVGWVVGAVRGSVLNGQVAAAVAALLISLAALLYAFRLGNSPASE